MFPRVTTIKDGGKTYQYLQIVQSYREDGKNKKRVLGNLGRLDLIGRDVEGLVRKLRRFCEGPLVAPEEIASESCAVWGPVLVMGRLWEEMGLGEKIARLCRSQKRQFDIGETAFVLVANRVTEPGSEHGLGRWLEHTFVCDREGRRWEPDWLAEEEITKRQRVRVRHEQLNRWYRTLDGLLGAKEELERELYLRVRDLFSVEVDLVFYDVTSTFFQRRERKGKLRRHGKSRDGHPREVQVVVGVVVANGWPIAHHVFSGNTADMTTLPSVVSDVKERFGLNRIVVVTDRGMSSAANLEYVRGRGFRYLVGIKGRRSTEAAEVFGRLCTDERSWIRVDETNRVQEVRLDESGVRYLVVDSAERKGYEESLREKSMGRARRSLEGVVRSVESGRLKESAKIAAAAGCAMKSNHASRYFSYEVVGDGQFRFWEDGKKLWAEMEREGRYILKTDVSEITALDAVEAYKELSTVEAGFRDLKDVLAMRPVWHKRDERVCAHIFVAALGLFLKRALQHHLDRAKVNLTATEALESLKSVGITELDLDGVKHRVVSAPGRDARRVLSAVRIVDLHPPGSRRGAERHGRPDVVTNEKSTPCPTRTYDNK